MYPADYSGFDGGINMRKIVLSVFLGTVAGLYIMSRFDLPSTAKFFFGAFGFGLTFMLIIILPLLITYKD